VLLLWAVLLRNIEIRRWMIAATLPVEVAARAVLLDTGVFVAYMAVPNWATVVLLGLMRGARADASPAGAAWKPALGLMAFLAAWGAVAASLGPDATFPFMRFDVLGGRSRPWARRPPSR
jgi:hypothetical protein